VGVDRRRPTHPANVILDSTTARGDLAAKLPVFEDQPEAAFGVVRDLILD